MKERHQWNPTGIFAGASAAQYIQDWSEEESGEEIKFAAATKFFRERNTKVDYKKMSCRKTLWHWVIGDKMADDIQTTQI